MNNNTITLKIRQRLQKLTSNDSRNIDCWQLVEAFNKFQIDWVRKNSRGINISRQGDEQSISRIDDLQILLKNSPEFSLKKFDGYQETTTTIPEDFLRYKRFIALATTEECEVPRPLKVWLAEEANVDILLSDKNKQPNFDWAETFAVFKGGKIQIYNGGKFIINSLVLVYYRNPVKIQIKGCKDPYSGNVPAVDTECEFNDDLCEVFIEGAANILAGDIENNFQLQRTRENIEKSD